MHLWNVTKCTKQLDELPYYLESVNNNDIDNKKTFIAKVLQRKSVNHTSTQFNLKDISRQ